MREVFEEKYKKELQKEKRDRMKNAANADRLERMEKDKQIEKLMRER